MINDFGSLDIRSHRYEIGLNYSIIACVTATVLSSTVEVAHAINKRKRERLIKALY